MRSIVAWAIGMSGLVVFLLVYGDVPVTMGKETERTLLMFVQMKAFLCFLPFVTFGISLFTPLTRWELENTPMKTVTPIEHVGTALVVFMGTILFGLVWWSTTNPVPPGM